MGKTWAVGAALTAIALTVQAADPPSGWSAEWPSTDFSKTAVPFDEILSGGPPKDGIPAIDAPVFAPVAVSRLEPVEPVLSLEVAGDARAYPLRILIWHEIVNDTVGGQPVAITYCPLCNSGAAFLRNVDGAVTSFGTTGKLRNSDLVMYDRESESWWQQFTGKAIVGARLGTTLERLPLRLEPISAFAARSPDGLVLTPPSGGRRDYGRNPYEGYDRAAWPFLFRGSYDGPGRPLMRVVAVEGERRAWSMAYLRAAGSVQEGDLRLRWTPGQASALDSARIAAGRDIGTVTVERRVAGAWRLAVYDVPFAFAFLAFTPGGEIRHPD
ncbi:MAG: DUF3179 domain-containing protein [Pseudomonadota bacterium]